MKQLPVIFKRELASYFATPLAYVFILIFLVLSGVFTFYLGGFYESGQADLAPFFNFHPWLYLFLVPAIAMRLWAEERKSGSIELLTKLRRQGQTVRLHGLFQTGRAPAALFRDIRLTDRAARRKQKIQEAVNDHSMRHPPSSVFHSSIVIYFYCIRTSTY